MILQPANQTYLQNIKQKQIITPIYKPSDQIEANHHAYLQKHQKSSRLFTNHQIRQKQIITPIYKSIRQKQIITPIYKSIRQKQIITPIYNPSDIQIEANHLLTFFFFFLPILLRISDRAFRHLAISLMLSLSGTLPKTEQ